MPELAFDQKTYEDLLKTALADAVRRACAGLRYAASDKVQDYPPGILELGTALDAINLVAQNILYFIRVNTSA